MKKLLLSCALMGGVFACHAQQVLTYNFKGNLNEANNAGPALQTICTGQFGMDTLPDYNQIRQVYQFDKNCGFSFNDSTTNFLAGGSYTIELYFKLKELPSWKRVIDFKSRTSDGGCYVYNGQLNFYPTATSSGAPFAAEEYSHYVITRNASNKQILMYGDGNKFINFTDASDAGVYDAHKRLNFFHDDLVVPNEASSGSIALLKIYNYALDSTIIKTNYDDLSGSLSITRTNSLQYIKSYPNPVHDVLTISLPQANNYEYNIYDLSGRLLQSGKVVNSQVPVVSLPKGLYQMRVQNERGESGTLKVLKD